MTNCDGASDANQTDTSSATLSNDKKDSFIKKFTEIIIKCKNFRSNPSHPCPIVSFKSYFIIFVTFLSNSGIYIDNEIAQYCQELMIKNHSRSHD